jgi:hypothetical protein
MMIKRITYHQFTTMLFVWLATTTLSNAQTNISGVVNDYTNVSAIDYIGNHITVGSASSFSIGDRVLVIQMQGATIDQSQSSTFGSISNYNNAGNYELQTICDIQGQNIYLTYDLVNMYDPAGSLQLIRVPVYSSATISGGNLTSQAWNGTTGGVVVLEVTGNLDFGTNDIDVSGLGFRGGTAVTSGQNCSWSLDASYYSSYSSTDQKALKGEGITGSINSKECGRGPQANGGGGGGANYGKGGKGGERIKRSLFVCGAYAGVDSRSLASGYSANRIFMGGGGGAGHVNNTVHVGEHGKNGGGIVIIKAGSITGNGQTIYANGISHTNWAANDGGGGGGAGGSVFIHSGSYTGNLNINVNGGHGAYVYNTGTSNCNGPGGGGGGGVVYLNASSVPASVNVSSAAGVAGQIAYHEQSNCTTGSTNNASNGNPGATLTGLILQEGIINIGCSTILPVELISFTADVVDQETVDLKWVTASEFNNKLFEIERSKDGISWEMIGVVNGAGTTTLMQHYKFRDNNPLSDRSYYRLKQVDINGTYSYSVIRDVHIKKEFLVSVYPNPATDVVYTELYSDKDSEAFLTLTSSSGMTVSRKMVVVHRGLNTFETLLTGLPSGIYIMNLSIPDDQINFSSKLMVGHER